MFMTVNDNRAPAAGAVWRALAWALLVSACCAAAFAENHDAPPGNDLPISPIPGMGLPEPVVIYPAGFFERYRPNTALDMVRQVPGFQLDDGGDQRGFGGAVGNLLINDRYPSAKQDKPSQILARIPAAQVERIELIRGQVREIDLLGRPVAVNLVMVEDTGAATRWELWVRRNLAMAPLAPGGSISISDRWRGLSYNAGVDARLAAFGDPGFEDVLDGSGALVEHRIEDHVGTGYNANAYFTASSMWGATSLQFNSAIGAENRDETLITTNVPQAPGSSSNDDRFLRIRRNTKIELGVNAERNLSEDLGSQAILLFNLFDQEPRSSQRSFDPAGDQTLFREATTDARTTESIARVELVWSRFRNHTLQLNVEGAKNVLDSALVQIADTGAGPEIVDVPGANTRVEEIRGDVLINDIWSLGNFEIEYGIGAEKSTISQSGDAELERSFTFFKPRAGLTYSASPARQTRLRLAKEVSQLDFNDFVSATVFEDDDLALGNPNLKPESTWIAELSEEWRFGELGVVKVTAFHHWISDVEDLLPLSSEFEAPGNIGDGRRWGVELETTLPLDALGLTAARLDIKTRWQDSAVTDPVTARDRVLSSEGGNGDDIIFRNENRHALIVDYRQDFDRSQISWGAHFATRAERPLFKVNELDVFDEGKVLNVFVETSRWLGLKIRLEGLNLFDIEETRDRTVFSGERDLSSVAFREVSERTNGRRLTLTFIGGF